MINQEYYVKGLQKESTIHLVPRSRGGQIFEKDINVIQ